MEDHVHIAQIERNHHVPNTTNNNNNKNNHTKVETFLKAVWFNFLTPGEKEEKIPWRETKIQDREMILDLSIKTMQVKWAMKWNLQTSE